MHSGLRVLDPVITTAHITRNHAYMIYDVLIAQDSQYQPQPQMADWTVSDDQLTYTFTLRDGLTFHNGKDVTAEDVLYTISRVAESTGITTEITSMVFLILIGASLFSLVFRGFGGEALIEDALHSLPGGVLGAFLVVMLVIFLLGFILDFIEIIFVVVPIVGPILLAMGLDPVWLGVMFAINLQTSFLTPPFGFSLFYLRGVTPRSVPTSVMYKGVLPFIMIQIGMLVVAYMWPGLVTWLPEQVYGK